MPTKALGRVLEERTKDAIQLRKEWKAIVDEFEGQYIAYVDGMVRAAARTMTELLRAVDGKGISRSRAIIRCAEREVANCLTGL
jgi:hypothetical protein